jgi:ABC-2 type transport system ATP-binding protein
MLKAVIYDLDGVLLDSESAILRSWQRVYEHVGQVFDVRAFTRRIGLHDPDWNPYAPLAREGVDVADLRKLKATIEADLVSSLTLRPGMRSWLDWCLANGVRVGCASSSPREWVGRHLARLGVLGNFDAIVSRDDVPQAKPAADCYIRCLRELSVGCEDAVAVEDSAPGLASARAAGIRAVLYPHELTQEAAYEMAQTIVDPTLTSPRDAYLACPDPRRGYNGNHSEVSRMSSAADRSAAPERDKRVIHCEGLTKEYRLPVRSPGVTGFLGALVRPRYETKAAVTGVNLTVGAGELLALLGPNGAGKSTTIKMLTGILVPTSGTVTVLDTVPHEDRIRNARQVGAVFGQRTQLWWDLPVRESFTVLREMFGIDKESFRDRLAEFDRLLSLSDFWDARVRQLSLGQRVRCDLAAALLHDPKVLFLDEPTVGMDIVAKEQVREFLQRQVKERGRTVLLTTHDMAEVDRLAERVALINHGQLVYDGPLAGLKSRFGGQWRLNVTLEEAVPGLSVPGALVSQDVGTKYRITPAATAPAERVDVIREVVSRYRVLDIATEESDLEDVMRAAYTAREGMLEGRVDTLLTGVDDG